MPDNVNLSSKRSRLSFWLILLALMVEGFDLQAANFAAPALVESLGLSRAQIGPFLSASLFGVLIGAAFIGPLGDKFGRKKVIVWCCAIYGVLSLIAALATDLTQLIGLRFLIGVGLGGVLPNALALAGELADPKRRAGAMGMVGIGITMGAVLAGAVSAQIIPAYGWPSLFIVGGILPLIIAGTVHLALPESNAVKAAETDLAAGQRGVRALLTGRNGPKTIAIWLIFASILMNVYLLSGWIPLLMSDTGYSMADAAWIATAYHGGGVAGGIVASKILPSREWKTVAGFAALSAFTLLTLAVGNWSAALIPAFIIAAGFFVTGTQNAINGAAGDTYDARIRATGLGWALGIGRIGSIAGPLVGSLAVLLGLSQARHFFLIPVLPLLLAAGLAIWLANYTRNPENKDFI